MNNSVPSPLTAGFRAVLRAPSVLLMEVAWRWCFGLIAGLLLFFGWTMATGSAPVSRAAGNAWQSRDAYRMALAALQVLVELGPKIMRVAMVLPVISVLWMAISAAGRTFTMKRLAMDGREVGFRAMLVLHLWRTLLTWVVFIAMAASVVGAALVSQRGPQPDYVMYYALGVPLVGIAALFWSIVNWYLSAAAAWVGKDGAGAGRAVRLAMGFTAVHRGDVVGLNMVFMLLRLMAMAVAFVLCALPGTLAVSAPPAYAGWVAAVSLAYFVLADFMQVSRLASYLLLDVPKPDVPASELKKIIIGTDAPSEPAANPEDLAVPNGISLNGQ
jgi:hypothetical protein